MPAYPNTFPSTAQALKAALVTALQAMTVAGGELDGVEVTYGWGGRDAEREWLFLGDIKWESESWAPLGARQREENYTIDLIVNIATPGQGDTAGEARAFQLLGVVENYLRTNPFAALGRYLTQDIVPVSSRTGPQPEGSEIQLEAHIRVMARI